MDACEINRLRIIYNDLETRSLLNGIPFPLSFQAWCRVLPEIPETSDELFQTDEVTPEYDIDCSGQELFYLGARASRDSRYVPVKNRRNGRPHISDKVAPLGDCDGRSQGQATDKGTGA